VISRVLLLQLGAAIVPCPVHCVPGTLFEIQGTTGVEKELLPRLRYVGELCIISSCVWTPLSVNPRDVSSTNASMSRECCMVESGLLNDILDGITLSSVFISVTTSVNQTAGDAPLPCPVPKSGESGVP